MKCLEPQIKAATLNYLVDTEQITSKDVVINEFTMAFFRRRADLIVVRDDGLIGFEIKSASDSLTRLEGQIKTYLDYCDKVVVVADSKHIPKVLTSVPCNVAVWEHDCNHNKITIHGEGKVIPIKDHEKVTDLMMAKDLLKLAKKLKIEAYGGCRHDAVRVLVNTPAPIDELRRDMLTCLKKRYDFSSRYFWCEVGGCDVKAKHIQYLSRYYQENSDRKKAIEDYNKLMKALETSHGET